MRLVQVLLFLLASSSSQLWAKTTKPPQRIIALAPHIVENLYAIGAGDRIVATVEYADHPVQAKEIERIGGYHGVQLERLLALEPDLVIAWRSGNKAEDLAKIEQLGIPIAYSNPNNIDNLAQEIRHLGELTQLQAKANQVAEKFEQRLLKIKQSNENKHAVAVFYQLWPEPMMTISKNTWINQLLTICQGENVFANSRTDYPQISIENVLVAKPQVIIIPDEKSDKPQPSINWQQWPELPAVKYNQFINVNADLLHRFTTRMLDGLADMCDKLDVSRQQIEAANHE